MFTNDAARTLDVFYALYNHNNIRAIETLCSNKSQFTSAINMVYSLLNSVSNNNYVYTFNSNAAAIKPLISISDADIGNVG